MIEMDQVFVFNRQKERLLKQLAEKKAAMVAIMTSSTDTTVKADEDSSLENLMSHINGRSKINESNNAMNHLNSASLLNGVKIGNGPNIDLPTKEQKEKDFKNVEFKSSKIFPKKNDDKFKSNSNVQSTSSQKHLSNSSFNGVLIPSLSINPTNGSGTPLTKKNLFKALNHQSDAVTTNISSNIQPSFQVVFSTHSTSTPSKQSYQTKNFLSQTSNSSVFSTPNHSYVNSNSFSPRLHFSPKFSKTLSTDTGPLGNARKHRVMSSDRSKENEKEGLLCVTTV